MWEWFLGVNLDQILLASRRIKKAVVTLSRHGSAGRSLLTDCNSLASWFCVVRYDAYPVTYGVPSIVWSHVSCRSIHHPRVGRVTLVWYPHNSVVTIYDPPSYWLVRVNTI